MANQLQKFNGEITTGLDLDLLWSILQNTGGGGGGFDISTLNKEDTQILVSQILQSLVIATQATNTQLASNIATEVGAINLNSKEATQLSVLTQINALITQVNAFKNSNTTENGLINKEATQLSVLTQINALVTQVNAFKNSNTSENNLILTALNNLLLTNNQINTYNVANGQIIIGSGSSNGATTYAGSRKKMIVRVTAGTVGIVAGSPPGANWQFWQNSNRSNLQTVLPVGVWVSDSVPNYFTIGANLGTCEVTLYS
jgi:hypothetical protein